MATKYEVTAVSARLSTGVLILTKEQAAPRLHNLKSLGSGKYLILNPVEFKSGEKIGYDGELPKALANALEEEGKAQSKAEKKAADAKAKADAAAKVKEEADKAEAKAKSDWDASEELRKEFPEFADYLAKLSGKDD